MPSLNYNPSVSLVTSDIPHRKAFRLLLAVSATAILLVAAAVATAAATAAAVSWRNLEAVARDQPQATNKEALVDIKTPEVLLAKTAMQSNSDHARYAGDESSSGSMMDVSDEGTRRLRAAKPRSESVPVPFFGRNDGASMREMASHLDHLLEKYKEDLVKVVQVKVLLCSLHSLFFHYLACLDRSFFLSDLVFFLTRPPRCYLYYRLQQL